MLVAGATLSLMAPIAAQASDVVNLEEITSYSRNKKKSSRIDSNSFTNTVSEKIVNLNGRVNGLETGKIIEAGGYSDTTSLDGKAVFFIRNRLRQSDSTQSEAVNGITCTR